MATQTYLYYLATSRMKEVRVGGDVTFDWGAYSKWTTYKNPTPKSKKKVAYSKKTKNSWNTAKGRLVGAGDGQAHHGTVIPRTAQRTISGVTRTCDVRYYERGKIVYERPSNLKSDKKMYKKTFTNTYPYQYRLQYKDKPVLNTQYTSYTDGIEYIYFANHYYDSSGNRVSVPFALPHPSKCDISYSDCRRNFDSSANNSDGRDNKGSYVLSNVRANIVTLTLEWTGMYPAWGQDLLNTLNPSKDKKGNYPYIRAQYYSPALGKAVNGLFFASNRSVEVYPDGYFKKISVTLTEV